MPRKEHYEVRTFSFRVELVLQEAGDYSQWEWILFRNLISDGAIPTMYFWKVSFSRSAHFHAELNSFSQKLINAEWLKQFKDFYLQWCDMNDCILKTVPHVVKSNISRHAWYFESKSATRFGN